MEEQNNVAPATDDTSNSEDENLLEAFVDQMPFVPMDIREFAGIEPAGLHMFLRFDETWAEPNPLGSAIPVNLLIGDAFSHDDAHDRRSALVFRVERGNCLEIIEKFGGMHPLAIGAGSPAEGRKKITDHLQAWYGSTNFLSKTATAIFAYIPGGIETVGVYITDDEVQAEMEALRQQVEDEDIQAKMEDSYANAEVGYPTKVMQMQDNLGEDYKDMMAKEEALRQQVDTDDKPDQEV